MLLKFSRGFKDITTKTAKFHEFPGLEKKLKKFKGIQGNQEHLGALLTITEVRLWRCSRITSSAQRELKTAPCHTRRVFLASASLASWLVTALYEITIRIASGEVATEHSVLRQIAKTTRERQRCRLYQYFQKVQFL